MLGTGWVANIKALSRAALWRAAPRLFYAAVEPWTGQTFSIAIYGGPTLHALVDAPGVVNPVLAAEDVTDVPAAFVADPFMIRQNNAWFMFFEVLDRISRRGVIGLATSDDGLRWDYQRVVLREPFHLAYPHVFEWNHRIFMVPDSPGNGIRLYEAVGFPFAWRLVKQLNVSNHFCDTSVFCFADRWWMFAGWVRERGDAMSLRLFNADQPTGPWREHPESPVVRFDDEVGRPAGRVQVVDGVPYRFAQNCAETYGTAVAAIEIDQLTPTHYSERRTHSRIVLGAGTSGWHAGGMHHLDAHRVPGGGWIASVDGWRHP